MVILFTDKGNSTIVLNFVNYISKVILLSQDLCNSAIVRDTTSKIQREYFCSLNMIHRDTNPLRFYDLLKNRNTFLSEQ